MEDPGQRLSLLSPHHDVEDDDDDDAIAETALDSPIEATGYCDPALQAPTTTDVDGLQQEEAGPSSTIAVKEPPPQTALKLPLDQNDYLQPQSSLPATYLDLVASPGLRAVAHRHNSSSNYYGF